MAELVQTISDFETTSEHRKDNFRLKARSTVLHSRQKATIIKTPFLNPTYSQCKCDITLSITNFCNKNSALNY